MTSEGTTPSSGPQVLGGRYEIRRRIARGGMAEVHLARDRSLDRPVAVKVLFPEFATDPAFVERFRREAQAAANLAHPNIVGVYDWGSENGTYFIVMEFVDGQSLADLMREAGPLNPRRAAEITFEVAGALGVAHSKGVVHRDVKPGNVLIAASGTPKVVDFGIARALSSPSEELTQAGSVMGTATYFSPEQAQGFAVDARSDLYSLGVVLFEMVTGRPPFTGDSPVAIAYKHVQEPPARPSSLISGLPEGLEAIMGKLLAKHPDNRYLSAEDLRADLRRFLDGETPFALTEQRAARAAGPATMATAAVVAGAVRDPGATQVVPVTHVPPGDEYDEYDDAEFEEEDGPSRTGLFVGLLVILLLIAGGLVFWLVRSLGSTDTNAEKATVPDVVRLERAVAEQKLKDVGFTVSFADRADETIPIDVVIEQSPRALDTLETGRNVLLTVSTGPSEVAIPTGLNGLTQEEATTRLTVIGLTVNPVQVQSETVEAGRVVGTTPAAGVKAKSGDPVELQVSTGPPQVAIPDVKGKNESQARNTLERAGFKVSRTIEVPSPDVAKGRAIGTDPGGTAAKNAALDLQISSGPDDVAVPSVKGQTEADATAAVKARGLDVEINPKSVPGGDPSVGRVVEQSPAGGSTVRSGTAVTLTIGVAAATTTQAPTTTAPPPTTTTTAP